MMTACLHWAQKGMIWGQSGRLDVFLYIMVGESGIVGWLSGLSLGSLLTWGPVGDELSQDMEVPAKAGLLKGLVLVWVNGAPWRL